MNDELESKPGSDPAETSAETSSRLDQLLAEAAAAERREDLIDHDSFMTGLWARIAPVVPRPFADRPGMVRVFAIAAMIPLALALWLFFSGPEKGTVTPSADELAMIEDLDLLELLTELSPEEIGELDPDLLDLYLHLDVIEELPVEVLGNS